MKTINQVTVGDPMVVVYRTGRYLHKEERTATAVVVDAKRVNLVLQETGVDHSRPSTWRLRRDTRSASGLKTRYGWHGYTADEYEQYTRNEQAHDVLNEHGVMLLRSSKWWGRESELADLLFVAEEKP